MSFGQINQVESSICFLPSSSRPISWYPVPPSVQPALCQSLTDSKLLHLFLVHISLVISASEPVHVWTTRHGPRGMGIAWRQNITRCFVFSKYFNKLSETHPAGFRCFTIALYSVQLVQCSFSIVRKMSAHQQMALVAYGGECYITLTFTLQLEFS